MVAEVLDLGCADAMNQLEGHRLDAKVVEVPTALPEENGDDVEVELVELPGVEQGLRGARGEH